MRKVFPLKLARQTKYVLLHQTMLKQEKSVLKSNEKRGNSTQTYKNSVAEVKIAKRG